MIENSNVDLWSLVGQAPVICITTNGQLKKDGKAVMGRGCAAEAVKLFSKQWDLALIVGGIIQRRGNVPSCVGMMERPQPSGNLFIWPAQANDQHHQPRGYPTSYLWTFPVKHFWKDQADPRLVLASAKLLVWEMSGQSGPIVIPRPGCGNGGLDWTHVKPLIAPILDDRFYIVHKDST